ncbi:MAG: hypothetical protein RBS89_10610 [Candidatus Delongbacteria bacterium]|nr:hypothetical protein [Candidatus Delongbacteria bacterium]
MRSLYTKTVSLITLIFFFNACTSNLNNLKEVPKENIMDFKKENIIVIRFKDISLLLENAVLAEETLNGVAKGYEKSSVPQSLFNEIHFVLDPEFGTEFILEEHISIPLDKVVKVEMYDINSAEAAGNLAMGFTGVVVISGAILTAFFGTVYLVLSIYAH